MTPPETDTELEELKTQVSEQKLALDKLTFQHGKQKQELEELREQFHAVLRYLAEKDLMLVKKPPVPAHYELMKMPAATVVGGGGGANAAV